MHRSRLQAWTRRRFGVVTSAAIMAAVGLPAAGNVAARKRKKRCRRINQPCRLGSKKKRCCKDLSCGQGQETTTNGGRRCCRGAQAACAATTECCLPFECRAIGLEGNQQCCGLVGAPCEEEADCCPIPVVGSVCVGGRCQAGGF